MSRAVYQTVTRARRCPVCNADHKCAIGDDRSVQCGHVPDGLREGGSHNNHVFLGLSSKDPQFGIFRASNDPELARRERERKDEWDRNRRGEQRSTNGRTHHDENGAHDQPDMEALARRYVPNLTPERRDELAQALGLRVDVLARMPLLGFFATDPHGPCCTFPECDGAGRVVGISRRYGDGRKLAVPNGGRGLTLLDGWDGGEGPVFLPEGQSDSLALAALNLSVVGRPSNTGGVGYLAELLKDFPADREIIVVGEFDANDKGRWPGLDGAKATAARIAEALKRPVKWALPPKGAKDVRAWVVAQQMPIDCLDSWGVAGEKMSAGLIEKSQVVKPEPVGGFRWEAISSTDFAAADYKPEWLVRRQLVKLQPAIVGGPKKTLKTSLLVDLAVSLATGTPFLGKFQVPKRVRVAIFSGESGPYTLQETAARICRARCLSLTNLGDFLSWQFSLPQFSKTEQLAELGRGIRENGVEVLIADPLYLSLLAGQGPGGASAANLFDMGPLLLAVSQTCLSENCTPILAHHSTKHAAHEPLDLDSLAFAGISEFARQWILTSRREKYEGGTGEHKLWLNVGGSTGHGGLWGVDISEGRLADDFSGRKWELTVKSYSEERQSAEEAIEEAKRRKREKQDSKDDDALLEAIDRLDPERQGCGWNKVQTEARLTDPRMGRAVNRLKVSVIDEVPVVADLGSKAKRSVKGLKRRGDS